MKRTCISLWRMQDKFLGDMQENPDVFTEEVIGGKHPVIAVICMKENHDRVIKNFQESGLSRVSLPAERTPQEEIQSIGREISGIEDDLNNDISALEADFFPKRFKYEVINEVYENRLVLENESQKTARTKYLTVLSGWIPESMKAALQEFLNGNFRQCHVIFSLPEEGEAPPVMLKNSSFADSFEIVTNLYGIPSYGWIDPTPYLAPFFCCFFRALPY
jgi:V/A-type H+-transporting ATPase subunit I